MTKPPIAAALARTHLAAFGPDAAWDEAAIEGYQDKPFHWIFGDEHCFAVLKVIADEAEILTFATHPNAQRQGRATDLLADIRERLRTLGATRLFLDVAEDNAPARALYAAAGFKAFSTRAGYYANGADAICMNLELSPSKDTG